MWNTNLWHQSVLALAGLIVATCANAEPGDAKELAKARKDYARAMQGHDAGLQNAMRVELSYQLAKSRERAKRKARPDATRPSAPGRSAG